MSAFLGGGVPNFEIRDVAGMTDLLIRDAELGRASAATLGTRNVALMRGHGNICVGHDVMVAVYRAVYTELNAKLQAQAIALGGPITFLDLPGSMSRSRVAPIRMFSARGKCGSAGWRPNNREQSCGHFCQFCSPA